MKLQLGFIALQVSDEGTKGIDLKDVDLVKAWASTMDLDQEWKLVCDVEKRVRM